MSATIRANRVNIQKYCAHTLTNIHTQLEKVYQIYFGTWSTENGFLGYLAHPHHSTVDTFQLSHTQPTKVFIEYRFMIWGKRMCMCVIHAVWMWMWIHLGILSIAAPWPISFRSVYTFYAIHRRHFLHPHFYLKNYISMCTTCAIWLARIVWLVCFITLLVQSHGRWLLVHRWTKLHVRDHKFVSAKSHRIYFLWQISWSDISVSFGISYVCILHLIALHGAPSIFSFKICDVITFTCRTISVASWHL